VLFAEDSDVAGYDDLGLTAISDGNATNLIKRTQRSLNLPSLPFVFCDEHHIACEVLIVSVTSTLVVPEMSFSDEEGREREGKLDVIHALVQSVNDGSSGFLPKFLIVRDFRS
jgi:hypothetical protein